MSSFCKNIIVTLTWLYISIFSICRIYRFFGYTLGIVKTGSRRSISKISFRYFANDVTLVFRFCRKQKERKISRRMSKETRQADLARLALVRHDREEAAYLRAIKAKEKELLQQEVERTKDE